MDSKSSGSAGYSTESGRHTGTTLTDAARMWPTLDASAINSAEDPSTWLARRDALKAKGINGNGAGTPLGIAAQMWSTPNAHDGRRPGPDIHSTQGRNLSREAAEWIGRPDLTMPRAGDSGSSKADPRQLNPDFVEALMGFPPEWTACAPSATPSSLSAQRLRSRHSPA